MIVAAALALAQVADPTGSTEPLASQAFFTGAHLDAECREQIPMTCVSYILGASDAVQDSARQGGASPFCVGPQVTQAALVDVVVAYLRAHRERHEGRATEIVLAALREAYPCPARSGQ